MVINIVHSEWVHPSHPLKRCSVENCYLILVADELQYCVAIACILDISFDLIEKSPCAPVKGFHMT